MAIVPFVIRQSHKANVSLMSADPLAWLSDALDDLDCLSLRRQAVERESPQRGDQILIAGKAFINFGSNDYLGLAADPRVSQAVSRTLGESGWGSGASPLVTGRGRLHARLEEQLAIFEGTPAALLFSTGFAANVGAITALVSLGDAVFSDAKNHASIIDGCRLSGATIQVYRHNDVDHLRDLLSATNISRRRLIVTDSLFSMDGDLAPLPQIAQLASEHAAMLLVDEAHATGVFGANGRGVCEQLGVDDGVHVRVGTLSKALGSSGGFVAGSRPLIDWLANRARPYVFSTAMPEAMAAAGLEALRLVAAEPARRSRLLWDAARLRDRLSGAGLNVGASQSQIVPIRLGDPQQAMDAATALRKKGLFVPGIRPPTVPEGESLLRISLSWLHSTEHQDQLVQALREIGLGR